MKQFEKILWKTKQKLALSKQKWLLTIAVVIATATAAAALYSPPNRESEAATALRKQKAKIELKNSPIGDSSLNARNDGNGSSTRAAQQLGNTGVTLYKWQGDTDLPDTVVAIADVTTVSSVTVDTAIGYTGGGDPDSTGWVRFHAELPTSITSKTGYNAGNYNYKFSETSGDGIGLNDTVTFIQGTTKNDFFLKFTGTYEAPNDSVGFTLGYGYKVAIDTVNAKGDNLTSYNFTENGSGAAVDSGKFNVTIVNSLDAQETAAHNYVYKYTVGLYKRPSTTAITPAEKDTTITGLDSTARISTSSLTFSLGFLTDTTRYDSIQVHIDAKRISPFVTLVDSTGLGTDLFEFTDSILTIAGTDPGDTTYTFKARAPKGTFSFKGGKYPTDAEQEDKDATLTGESLSADQDSVYKFKITQDTTIYVFYEKSVSATIDTANITDKGFTFLNGYVQYPENDSVRFALQPTTTTPKGGTWQLLGESGTDPVDTIDVDGITVGTRTLRLVPAAGDEKDTIIVKPMTSDTTLRIKYIPTYDTAAVKKANESYIKELKVLSPFTANTDSSGYVKENKLTFTATLGQPDTIRGGHYALFKAPGATTTDTIEGIKFTTVHGLETGGGYSGKDTIKITEGIDRDTAFYVKYYPPAIWVVKTDTVGTTIASNIKKLTADTFQLQSDSEYWIQVELGNKTDTLRNGKYYLYGTDDGNDSIYATGGSGINYSVTYGTSYDSIKVTGISGDTVLFVKYVEPYKVTTDTVKTLGFVKSVAADTTLNTGETYVIKAYLGTAPDTIKGGTYLLYGTAAATTADSIYAEGGTIGYTVVTGNDYDSIKVTGITADTTLFVKYVQPEQYTVTVKTEGTQGDSIKAILVPSTGTVKTVVGQPFKIVTQLGESADTAYQGTYRVILGTTPAIGDTIVASTTPGTDRYAVVTYGTDDALGQDTIDVYGITTDTVVRVTYRVPVTPPAPTNFTVRVNTNAAEGDSIKSILVPENGSGEATTGQPFRIVTELGTDADTTRLGTYTLIIGSAPAVGDTITADVNPTATGIYAKLTYGTGTLDGKDTLDVYGLTRDTVVRVRYREPAARSYPPVEATSGDGIDGTIDVTGGGTEYTLAGGVKLFDADAEFSYVFTDQEGSTIAQTGEGVTAIVTTPPTANDTTFTVTVTLDAALSDTITEVNVLVTYEVPDTTITLTASTGLTEEEIGGTGAVTDGRATFIITPSDFDDTWELTFTYNGQELDESTTPAVRVETDNDTYIVNFSKVEDTNIEVTVTYTAPIAPHYPTYVTIKIGSVDDIDVAYINPVVEEPGRYTITGNSKGTRANYVFSLEYWDVTDGNDQIIDNPGIQGAVQFDDESPVSFLGYVDLPNDLPTTIDSLEVRLFLTPRYYPTVEAVAGEGVQNASVSSTATLGSYTLTGTVETAYPNAVFSYEYTDQEDRSVSGVTANVSLAGANFTGTVTVPADLAEVETLYVTVNYELPAGNIPVHVDTEDQSVVSIESGSTGSGNPGTTYTFTVKPTTPDPTGHEFTFLFQDGSSPQNTLPINANLTGPDAEGVYTVTFTVPTYAIVGTLNVTVNYVAKATPKVTFGSYLTDPSDVTIVDATTYTISAEVDFQSEDYQFSYATTSNVIGVNANPRTVSKDTTVVFTITVAANTDPNDVRVNISYVEEIIVTNIKVEPTEGTEDDPNDITAAQIQTTSTQGSNGVYHFTVTPLVAGGTLTATVETPSGAEYSGAQATASGNSGVYTVTVTGLGTGDAVVKVKYINPALFYDIVAGAGVTYNGDATPTSGTRSKTEITFPLTIITSRAGGTFAFVFKNGTTGDILNGSPVGSVKATTTEGVTTYQATVSNIYVNSLYVTVGYNAPRDEAAEGVAIPAPSAPASPDYDAELPTESSAAAAGDEGVLAYVPNVSNPFRGATDVSTLVPGESISSGVELTADAVSTARRDIVITFSGALAGVVEPLKIYNFVLTREDLIVVYKFISSTGNIIGSRSTGLRATAVKSYAEFDGDHTITIYLVDIDVDALPKEASQATITLNDEGQTILATVDKDIILYEHPVLLIPDNGVPSFGYAGYFTLGGDYPVNGLRYHVGEDNTWKLFSGTILNSEIERLANGERLYFALIGEGTPDKIFVYLPKTYNDVGGGNVEAPTLARNVNVHAASVSEGLISFTAVSGQWISTDGSFSFIVTPANPIPGYVLTLQFYTKEWITVTNKPTVEGNEIPNEDGTFTVTLKGVKVSDLQVVVTYTQGGEVGNTNVDNDKVWSNNGTLFINSITNSIAKVYNINGGLVKSVKVDANTLTTAELPQGTYIVTLNGKTTKVNTK